MPKYVEDCKAEHVKGCEAEYVECLFSGVQRYERDKKLSEKGIRALLELTKEQGLGARIRIEDLRKRSGITIESSQSAGMWVWVQAGVVDCTYAIRHET